MSENPPPPSSDTPDALASTPGPAPAQPGQPQEASPVEATATTEAVVPVDPAIPTPSVEPTSAASPLSLGAPPTTPIGLTKPADPTPPTPPSPAYGTPAYGSAPSYGQPGTAYGAPAEGPGQPYGSAPHGTTSYGTQPPPFAQDRFEDPQAKSRLAAGLLGIFLGGLGIHRFYLGHSGVGLIMLLLSVLSAGVLAPAVSIWGLVEGILYLTAKQGTYAVDATGRPLRA